jgi:hypothetical protein
MPSAVRQTRAGVLRHSRLDASLIGLSGVHAALLVYAPSVPLVAVGLWWTANTVAHTFIHQPFFRRRAVNRAYALFLSALLGFPQSAWRARHLAHHAGRRARLRVSRSLAIETGVVVVVWGMWMSVAPHTFLQAYLPGWALGLVLCRIQGHFEHVHGTTSHYGRLYNLLFFNDGYHAEHHARPGRHWSQLGTGRAGGRASRWPPVLRWLDAFTLEGLERVVLASPVLQRIVVAVHERAFRRLLPAIGEVRSVLVVGGGLFPRTALVLRRVLPDAALTVVDASADHLAVARGRLDASVVLRQGLFTGEAAAVDLVVVPLAYLGDRERLYAQPPARVTLVHDWIWSRHGRGTVVSALLLKRLNLVASSGDRARPVRLSA